MGRLTSAVNVIVSTKKPVIPLLVGTWGDRERTKSSNPTAAVKPAPSDEFVRALQTVREDRTALPESHLNVGRYLRKPVSRNHVNRTAVSWLHSTTLWTSNWMCSLFIPRYLDSISTNRSSRAGAVLCCAMMLARMLGCWLVLFCCSCPSLAAGWKGGVVIGWLNGTAYCVSRLSLFAKWQSTIT